MAAVVIHLAAPAIVGGALRYPGDDPAGLWVTEATVTALEAQGVGFTDPPRMRFDASPIDDVSR